MIETSKYTLTEKVQSIEIHLGNLENRIDDNEKVAVKRFEMYEENIKPVIEYYRKSNLLRLVNGEGSITKINNQINLSWFG